MKRLVGGDYLLDLSSIELEESEDGSTKTNITDSDVLEQLTNLKKYINNPEMAKPVWVKLKNGENDELVIARGTFSVIDTGEFEICVQLDGYKLVIFIEFTQATLDDDTPIDDWYIDTNDAKYLFTSDAQNVKATIEDADFGDVELAGDLSVGGDASVTGDLSVTGKINSAWEYEKSLTINPDWLNGLTLVSSFAKLQVKNGVVYIVISALLKNETENAITTPNNASIFNESGLPNDICAKIYRKDGTKVSENVGDVSNIISKRAYTSNVSGGALTNFDTSLNSNAVNGMFLYPRSQFTLNADASVCFDYRTFITL